MMQQRKKLLTRYNIGDYRVRDKKKRYNNFNLTLTATNEKTWSYYNRRIKKPYCDGITLTPATLN